MSDRIESRKQAFKNKGLTTDELRRRREEASVEIRKVKREETLFKKRLGASATGSSTSPEPFVISDEESTTESSITKSKSLELQEHLPIIKTEVFSDSLELQVHGTIEFRKILSKERNPPINEVIACDVVPRFIQFLVAPQAPLGGLVQEQFEQLYESLQFEASWALTNIASGNSQQTWTVVQHNAIPVFVTLLYSSSKLVQEQAIWALGNIAGDSPQTRDLVINSKVFDPLLSIVHQCMNERPLKLPILRNAAWTISNLCRGKPAPDWTVVSTSLSTLVLLLSSNDKEIFADTCWSLSYLSDGPNDHIEAVIQSGIIPRVIQLMTHESYSVQTPALRTMGNIVTGNDYQTQIALNNDVLLALLHLLSSPKSSIVKEACWAISNITAGNPNQIQAMIDANIVPSLVHILSHADFKTKKEACWAISNATSAKSTRPEQTRYLVSQGIIKPLCDILACQDNKIILVALDGLEAILSVGEMSSYQNTDMANQYAIYVEEAGGMDLIYQLQGHENEQIYNKAKGILDKYFNDEEEDFSLDVPSNQMSVNPTTGTFQFSSESSSMPLDGFKFS